MILRGLTLAALTVAAGLAVWVQTAHYDQRDDAEAVLRVRTHRFGPSSRMRLSTYLKATQRRAGATWHTQRHRLSGQTQVTLQLSEPATRATFTVDRDGQVSPSDAAAQTLIEAVVAHAKLPSQVVAPVSTPERNQPSQPPVRPHIPNR